jgi:geranylgeranyl reductase family protein
MGHQRTDFDVIVVGAGPSGTAAAYRLVQSGYKVLLLDKGRSSRGKPCGGGITIKSLNLMPYSVGSVIEQATKRIGRGLTSSGRRRFEIFETDGYVCTFAVRKNFDQFNLNKTIEAGAQFARINELSEIEEYYRHVRIVCDRRAFTARYLIGADGANSTVRRLIKAGDHFQRGFAIEALVDRVPTGSEPIPEFFFGYVSNGYGWIFPKRDHINVGIYTHDNGVRLSKDLLREYVIDRLGTDKFESIVGFPLSFGGQGYHLERARIVLTGDAAGLADPFLGEGIYNAIKSGQSAATAILSVDKSNEKLATAYAEALNPIYRDLSRCEYLKRLIYSNLVRLSSESFSLPFGKNVFMRGFAAGKTIYELTNSCFMYPFFRPIYPTGLRDFLSQNSG